MKIKKEGKEEVRMQFIITKDYDELSQVISSTMLKHMHTDKPRVNICVTTGTTPIQAYQILAPKVKDKAYFEHVHYYVVDEFWYAKDAGTQNEDIPVNKMSMDLKFFQAANIPEERIHTLRDDNVETFDQAIQRAGGMDMVIMGIGTDGHFCGNHPGTFDDWKQGCHSIDRYCTPQVNELLEFLLKDDIHSDDVSRMHALSRLRWIFRYLSFSCILMCVCCWMKQPQLKSDNLYERELIPHHQQKGKGSLANCR